MWQQCFGDECSVTDIDHAFATPELLSLYQAAINKRIDAEGAAYFAHAKKQRDAGSHIDERWAITTGGCITLHDGKAAAMAHYHTVSDWPLLAPAVIRDCFPPVAVIVRPKSTRTFRVGSRFMPLASGEASADVRMWCKNPDHAKVVSGCVVDSGCSNGIAVTSVGVLPADFRPSEMGEEAELANGSLVQSVSGPVRLQISGTSTSAEVISSVLGGSQNFLGCQTWRYPGYTVALLPTGECTMIEPGHSLLPVGPGQALTLTHFYARWSHDVNSFCELTFRVPRLPVILSDLRAIVSTAFSVLRVRYHDAAVEFSLSCQVRVSLNTMCFCVLIKMTQSNKSFLPTA